VPMTVQGFPPDASTKSTETQPGMQILSRTLFSINETGLR
jgi:hypothetical protein